jgi:hypothetical protein
MQRRLLAFVSVMALAIGFVLFMPALTAAQSTAPRTAWGRPDLNGTWDFRTITPLERPDKLADREFLSEEEAAKLERDTVDRNRELDERPAERAEVSGGTVDRRADGSPGFYNNYWLDSGTKPVSTRRTSLVVDPPNGRVPPLTADGQRRVDARRLYRQDHPADSWLDRSTSDRCLIGFNAGPPLTPGGYNQNLGVFQTPDHVALITEMIHTVRIVPLDGRPPLSDEMRQWSGESRGRWEGNTLVIETAHFRDDRAWRGSTGTMKLVERLTRTDAETLEYTYTVTDPDTWTRPWTASIPLRRTEQPMYEYACHEGNYSMPHLLSGQRAEEKEAVTKATAKQ